MGTATGDVATAAPPLIQHEDGASDDHKLVAAVRRGDDRAFECLYSRYHRRIQAYVVGMCKDHGRAEDITQEIFVSALRRMRETERPIAFKPWIYEIAKNACIDQHRRARRTEEVSLEADDGLAPADYGRLVNAGLTPDEAVVAKQDFEDLCGAFGGLSETHHQILVMRELEGLSYREIGERLGMSRPAVESTLFRARKRLTEEYDDLVSGQRCRRVQGIIAGALEGAPGTRDARRLARHVAHCQPCRREALAAGLDAAILTMPRRSVAARIAALLPFPLLQRRGGGREAGDVVSASSGWVAHLPALSDHAGAGSAKLATAAAVLIAGAGGAAGLKAATGPAEPDGRARSGDVRQAAPRTTSGAPSRAGTPAAASGGRTAAGHGGGAARTRAQRGGAQRGSVQRVGAQRAGRSDGTGSSTASTPRSPGASAPALAVPPAASDPGAVPGGTTPPASPPAGDVVNGVQDTVGAAVGGATGTAGPAAPVLPDAAADAVQDAVDAVAGATAGTTPAVPGG